MKKYARLWAGIAILALAGLACNIPLFGPSTPPAEATLGRLYTAAAMTLDAADTQAVTATPPASATNAFPTLPTIGPTRTSAPVALCDSASFVKDVTVPDGTDFGPEEDFTKTWRIQNVGTCTWTSGYDLVFVSGDRMSAPTSVGLKESVGPGQFVDLSVDMVAPDDNGEHQGFWKLRNAAGYLFGIGAQAQTAFWVKIDVVGPTYSAYNFVARYCDADWENNSKGLPCPGSEGDAKGYVLKLNDPILESGKDPGVSGLLTVPREAFNGFISGTYPAIKIKDGDRFQAWISCNYKAYDCNVLFGLDYQIGAGTVKSLGHWNEAYEGKYYPIDIDLSNLAGNSVKFTLSVSSNGAFDQDEALWIAPRLTRRGYPPPTDTSTSTPTNTPTSTATATSTSTPTSTPTPTDTAGP